MLEQATGAQGFALRRRKKDKVIYAHFVSTTSYTLEHSGKFMNHASRMDCGLQELSGGLGLSLGCPCTALPTVLACTTRSVRWLFWCAQWQRVLHVHLSMLHTFP